MKKVHAWIRTIVYPEVCPNLEEFKKCLIMDVNWGKGVAGTETQFLDSLVELFLFKFIFIFPKINIINS